ncbi:MAG: ankyrin repeat domain-containing protein [Clostridiaceae bacterium]|nr:ankyrin repeat domain-containing protein [Clostridiaceae bacterium]
MVSARKGYTEVVIKLMESSADINVINNDGMLAIKYALLSGPGEKGFEDIVNLLYKNGARYTGPTGPIK